MNRILVLPGVLVMGVFICSCGEPQQESAPRATLVPEASAAAAREGLAPPDTIIPVTARGWGIKGRMADDTTKEWSHNSAKQKQLPPGLLKRDKANNRVSVDLLPVPDPDSVVTASMDTWASHEGNLIRMHVDRPPHTGNKLLVIGFYDLIASDSAVVEQRYECVTCDEVTVCGVKPKC